MGKLLGSLVALVDLGLLALLVTSGNGNVLREAGLATSILLVGAIAWVAAFFNALYSAFRRGRDWRWILILLALIWLPALPVLAYGATAFYPLFNRGKRVATVPATSHWSLPPADPALRVGRRRAARGLLGFRNKAA